MVGEGYPETGGRLTDDVTIGLLTTTFPGALVDEVIEATGRREQRRRVLPARLMVYLSMALWLDSGNGYLRVLRTLLSGLRWSQGWDAAALPTDGAVSRARERLGSAPMKALFEATAAPTPAPAPVRRPRVVTEGSDVGDGPCGGGAVFWRGLRTVAVDTAVFDLPASRDNAAAFAVPSGGTLPQARLVVLAECGGLAALGAAFDSAAIDARALLRRLSDRLGPGMLLVADRGFLSRDAFASAAANGTELLWRADESTYLPVKERLPDGTYLSELPGPGTRLGVRVVEYGVRTDDGMCEHVVLVTTLTSPEQAPAAELARLHAARWRAEIILRLAKVDPHRPGGVLRSRTAEGVRQELWALLCVYQALRRLVTAAAVIPGVAPARIRLAPVPGTVANTHRKPLSS